MFGRISTTVPSLPRLLWMIGSVLLFLVLHLFLSTIHFDVKRLFVLDPARLGPPFFPFFAFFPNNPLWFSPGTAEGRPCVKLLLVPIPFR